jgi:hypothetical protein
MIKAAILSTGILTLGALTGVPGLHATALAQQQPLATGQYSADPDLRAEILEVKRVSGGALNVRWRLVHGAAQGGGLAGGGATKPIYYNFDWHQIYFVDPAENKKYQFLTDSGGNRILEVYLGNIAPGQQRMNWAKFPAPPANSNKITIYLPHFAPFEDIPVQ